MLFNILLGRVSADFGGLSGIQPIEKAHHGVEEGVIAIPRDHVRSASDISELGVRQFCDEIFSGLPRHQFAQPTTNEVHWQG